MSARALVVGADGLIGGALMKALQAEGYDVAGTTRRDSSRSGTLFHLDLAEPGFETLPAADVAFICAAMTRLADCRASPDLARRINYEAPVQLAERLVARGTATIFLSTAAVLDCEAPHMRADRPRDGRSLYGQWKGAAEAAILALGPRASVLRLTKVLTPAAALFRNWIAALDAGDTIEAFDDHRIAPLRVSDVVDALIAVARADSGLFQISGARDASYLDLARHLATLLQIPTSRIIGCSAFSHGISPEERTGYTSLDCSRLSALTGFRPPEPNDVLRELFVDPAPPARQHDRATG